jgi:hypothetical protein
MAKIQIRWNPNSLLPLPEQIKTFEWDENKYDYSEDAMRNIEVLMSMRVSFSVRTSETIDIEKRRAAIVCGTANPNFQGMTHGKTKED